MAITNAYKASGFFPGVIAGLAGLWVFHHFVRPIPGAKTSG